MSGTTDRRVVIITMDDAQTYRCCQLCMHKCEKKDYIKCPKFLHHVTTLSKVWQRSYRLFGDRMSITIGK